MLIRKSSLINAFCNIRGVIIISLFFFNIILTGVLYTEIKVTNAYEKKIEEKDTIIENVVNLQKEEIKAKSTVYYAQQIQKLLSEPELIFLAQKQWEYNLTLNGKVLKQDIIYINDDYARIILAELVQDRELLPEEILEKGTATGSDPNDLLQDHLSIVTNISYTTKVEESSQGRRVIYDFKKIPKGTIISLKMSLLLSERLKIGTEDQWESRFEIIRK